MKINPINFHGYVGYSLKNKDTYNEDILSPNSKGLNIVKYDVYKAYANISSNTPQVQTEKFNLELCLVDNVVEPQISIAIENPSNMTVRQGLYPLYAIVLNDSFYNKITENTEIELKKSSINENSRNINIICKQDHFLPTLEMIKETFIDLDINKELLDNAKHLAVVLFKLCKETNASYPEFSDIPKEMTVEEYKNLINEITIDDLKSYNSEVLKNSNKKIQLTINKDFYLQNEEKITNKLYNKG